MLPGGFKPPHEGHLQLAKGYEKLPNVKEVVILVGPKDRDGITAEDSIDAWKMLLAGTRNIRVIVSKYPSPLLTAYKYIEEKAMVSNNNVIDVTHQNIAYDLHTSRVVVSRLLKTLENDNKIELHRNNIKVLEL